MKYRNRVLVHRSVLESLKGLDPERRSRVAAAIDGLRLFPLATMGAVRLRGLERAFSLKVTASLELCFEFDEEERAIYVRWIGNPLDLITKGAAQKAQEQEASRTRWWEKVSAIILLLTALIGLVLWALSRDIITAAIFAALSYFLLWFAALLFGFVIKVARSVLWTP
jgi:mRNA-degrading endonuclease RelE of RelBE toxin-antitoxin system